MPFLLFVLVTVDLLLFLHFFELNVTLWCCLLKSWVALEHVFTSACKVHGHLPSWRGQGGCDGCCVGAHGSPSERTRRPVHLGHSQSPRALLRLSAPHAHISSALQGAPSCTTGSGVARPSPVAPTCASLPLPVPLTSESKIFGLVYLAPQLPPSCEIVPAVFWGFMKIYGPLRVPLLHSFLFLFLCPPQKSQK